MINLLDLEIDEKIFKRLLIAGIVIIICYLSLTYLSFGIPRIYRLSDDVVEDTGHSVETGIDVLKRGSFRLEISGWAYKKGESVDTFNSQYILRNRKDGRMYLLKTGNKIVQELQFIDNTYQCLNCGMVTESIVLGRKDGNYDLLVLYKNNGENLLVNTDVEVEI